MKICGDDLFPIVGNRTISSKATDKVGMTGKCLIPFDQDSWDSYNILIKEYRFKHQLVQFTQDFNKAWHEFYDMVSVKYPIINASYTTSKDFHFQETILLSDKSNESGVENLVNKKLWSSHQGLELSLLHYFKAAKQPSFLTLHSFNNHAFNVAVSLIVVCEFASSLKF